MQKVVHMQKSPAKKFVLRRKHVMKALTHLILIVGGLICLYPLIFTILAGFFEKGEFISIKNNMPLFPIAKAPTFKNYLSLFSANGLGPYMLNTVIRTVYSVFMAIVVSFLSGYCFGRLKFKGKRTLFMVLLFTAMVPGTISMIPQYIMYRKWINIYDTFWVYLIGGPAINIMGAFLVKQSMEKIPKDLDEAAKIDGANNFTIIFRILFPLSTPILIYLAATTAISTWNDWGTSFFFTESDALQTLPGAISRYASVLGSAEQTVDYPLIITLSLAITLPALLIFFCFQRYIVEGLAAVGIKG